MIKVLNHGARVRVKNPLTGEQNEMIRVRFIEEGRTGGNPDMSETSAFLDSLVGESTGLANFRAHTHLVQPSKIALFPVGKSLPGHINRKMFSTPQMGQQENVAPRMVGGKLTYFTTYISSKVEADLDLRLSISESLSIDKDGLKNAQLGTALVEVLEEPNPVEQLQPVANAGGTEELGE